MAGAGKSIILKASEILKSKADYQITGFVLNK
jgi:hypothetical protein